MIAETEGSGVLRETLEFMLERLPHWIAFVLAIVFALLGGGCQYTGGGGAHEMHLPTDRTLTFKTASAPRSAGTTGSIAQAAGTDARFQATVANTASIRRLRVQVFRDELEASGVMAATDIALPPFSGTVVLKGIRPGRKLVTVDAFDSLGTVIFSGTRVIDFAPGAPRFVEFILFPSAPLSAADFTGGPVDGDARLAASQSPYTIRTPIVVNPGATLVIEGGTTVQFDTPASTAPDILTRGRLLIGDPSSPVTLSRFSGRSLGPRIRIDGTRENSITNTRITGTDATAIEVSGGALNVTSSTFTDVRGGLSAEGASLVIAGNTFTSVPRGLDLASSTALVQSNRFTDTSTAVATRLSSVIVVSNVVADSAGAVQEGFRAEGSAATISQNRLTGSTPVLDAVTGRLSRGLGQGIVLLDSVSGTAVVTDRVLIEQNTISGAAIAGVAAVGSDPIVRLNRILDGRGGGAGSQGITVNRVVATFPKQPLIVSNVISGNTGPAVGFLSEAGLQPAGGGVLGTGTGEGNFISGNNVLNLGFTPGADLAVGGAVDGRYDTRTLQVFSVDAILSASATAIVEAGAPANVR